MEVSSRFKKVRLHLHLSQPEMSERVGLSRNAWQTYELGKSSPGTAIYQALLNMGFSVSPCKIRLPDGSELCQAIWFSNLCAFGVIDHVMSGCEVSLVFS